jgi:hypothetical protein
MNILKKLKKRFFSKQPKLNTWYDLENLKPSAHDKNYTQVVKFITDTQLELQGTFFEVLNAHENKKDIVFIAYNDDQENFNPTQYKSKNVIQWKYIELN